ncbi:MAG TPA: toxin-antitoxin system HicB family antitoxin [Actinomycetales bacterium]|jgi:hypothetical protein
MDLSPYVDDLQHRLATAAAAAGDDAQQLAGRLTAPLDAAVRLVLLTALSDAAGEISAELAPGSVDVRLRAGDPEFVVTAPVVTAPAAPDERSSPTSPPPSPEPAEADGGTTRTTLRLPDHLKSQLEVAAAREGISVNTWLVRAVATALEGSGGTTAPPGRTERSGSARVTGWVR